MIVEAVGLEEYWKNLKKMSSVARNLCLQKTLLLEQVQVLYAKWVVPNELRNPKKYLH